MKPNDDRDGPLSRYMQVLELVAAFRGAVTLPDVSAMLDLPKTTAHRLLKGLVRSGLARETAGSRFYDLGERLVRLLHATADDGWLVALARPHIERLTDVSTETCYLTRLVGARVFVAVSESPDARWRGYVKPGLEMPPNAAATAKAILAYQSKSLVDEALARELPKLTANTCLERKSILRELAGVRKRGHAECVGEIDEGLAAIAVPVILPGGAVFHAVGMTGPLQRIMNARLPNRLAALNETASALAKPLFIGKSIRSRELGAEEECLPTQRSELRSRG